MIHLRSGFPLQLHKTIVLLFLALLRLDGRVLFQKTRILVDERVAQAKKVDDLQMFIGVEAAGDPSQEIFGLLHDAKGLCFMQDVTNGDQQAADLGRRDELGDDREDDSGDLAPTLVKSV